MQKRKTTKNSIPRSTKEVLTNFCFFFQQACREGLVDIVRTVLQGGATTIDTLDEEGFAPIHHAVRYDRAEIVKLLINAGSGKKGRANRPAGFP